MITTVTDQNFDSLIQGEKLLMVDFWATWCGPCRMIAPIVEELAEEMADQLSVAKCNVDECEDVPANYKIMSIPTLLFFKGGQLVGKNVGAISKADLKAKIQSLL